MTAKGHLIEHYLSRRGGVEMIILSFSFGMQVQLPKAINLFRGVQTSGVKVIHGGIMQ